MTVMHQEILVLGADFRIGFNECQQLIGTEIHGLGLLRLDGDGHLLKAGQDIGTLDIGDAAKQMRQEGLVYLFVREVLVHHLVQGAGSAAGIGR